MKKTLLTLAILLVSCTPKPQAPEEPETQPSTELPPREQPQKITKTFYSSDLQNADSNLNFSAEIPVTWEAQYIPASQAINLYDPNSPEEDPLEKSQIFIKYFNASKFLTLQTVTIHERRETTTNSRPTVIYDIEKKASVKNFPSQPSWRSQRHMVTDIRSTDENPTTFYVFAKRPDFNRQIFDDFINSVTFNPARLTYPIENFESGITKKPFGVYITPETSPIQPERFSGYHTGVDIEVETGQDTPVYSIKDGTVTLKKQAQGYGGVLVINHGDISAVYGHLNLASIDKNIGDMVKAGEQIALLGKAYSDETDGERKHLHFAILNGKSTAIPGYVQSQSELAGWLDPQTYLKP